MFRTRPLAHFKRLQRKIFGFSQKETGAKSVATATAIAHHVKTTGHNIKWDHFDILASGKTDFHCKIKETLFIQELKPSLNVNVSNEKLLLY